MLGCETPVSLIDPLIDPGPLSPWSVLLTDRASVGDNNRWM